MLETLVPIILPPGLYHNGTKLDASGRWYDGNLMRWVEGKPQPIGGWRVSSRPGGGVWPSIGSSSATIVLRGALSWRAQDGTTRVAVGGMNSAFGFHSEEDSVAQLIGDPEGLAGRQDAVASGTGVYEILEADTWSFDLFGDTLVFVGTSDGRLWTWDGVTMNGGGLEVATAPDDNRSVVVTPERFLVLLGAGGNLRKVQWADQESTTVWTPTTANQAGDFELQTSGRVMSGARTKGQTLIWTDVDLWSMTYIGGDLIYGFQQEGDQCGLISIHGKAVTDTQAFWMGRNNFYMYDGFVRPLDCEVRDYVFEDFNATQASKVWATTIAEHSEVWWFYVSADATEIDRYVSYNYRSGHWSFGELSRTAGVDAGVLPVPVMFGTDRKIYDHEIAEDRGTETPFLESGPVTFDKDRVMRIQRIVPDVSALGDAEISIYTSMFPTQSETLNGPYSLANPTDVRLTAKHIRVRVEEATETSWRVGTTQLGVIPLGRR